MTPLSLVAVGAGMLILSWRKWTGLLTDAGRELYVPWRLSEGEILYFDVVHLFGPLSQYVNAMAYAVFGTQLLSIVGVNLAVASALTMIIYRFFLTTTDRVGAVATAATFLSVFFASQYGRYGNFSFVFPYSHEITHGIFLSFAGLLCFTAYLRVRRLHWLLGLGVCLGLVALTKVEVFAACATAFGGGFALMALVEWPNRRRWLASLLVVCLVGALPIVGFVLYFVTHSSLREAIEIILLPYVAVLDFSLSDNLYYRWVSGFDAPFANSIRMVMSAAAYLGFIAGLWALARHHQSISFARRWLVSATCIGAGVATLALVFSHWLTDSAYGFPILLVAFGGVLLRGLFQSRSRIAEAKTLVPLIVLTVFAFVLLGKIVLRVTVWHYGFALAMPAALIVVALMTSLLPRALGARYGGECLLRFAGVTIVGIVVASHVMLARDVYAERTLEVGSGEDVIVAWDAKVSDRGSRVRATLESIGKTLNDGDTFVVFPEGVMLNYLVRKQNPSAYIDFTPHLIAGLGEEQMLDSVRRGEPDWVILLESDTTAFGAQYFGVDYAHKLMGWVKENYAPVARLAVAGDREAFGVILKRGEVAR